MYPAGFAYTRASSLEEAISALAASNGEAKLLAGGHSLLPLMKLRLAEPAQLIDIGNLKDSLAYVRSENGEVAVGALTTHHTLETSGELRRRVPVVSEAAGLIGDVQVRNRGTIGGSLAHADPGADLPAVMLALGATFVAQGPGGRRSIDAADFFVDLLTTALRPDEVLVEVRLSALQARSGSAYKKFEQPASGYAIVGAAAVVRLGEGDRVEEARVALTGVSGKPYRAAGVEQALAGQAASAEAVAAAAEKAADGVDVAGDLHASSEYRAHLARVFARRALEEAVARARG
jgi:carbon-monoxide dehydrogenase medium subunit